MRTARIQDALREGQELIVQVEKEERGKQGRRPDHVHLAGRPPPRPDAEQPARRRRIAPRRRRGPPGTARHHGAARCPQGMSIIARTAGIGRNVDELQWDLSYLLQLWTAIDGAARDNAAPILIYLESSLVIRAIRDLFFARDRRNPDRYRRNRRPRLTAFRRRGHADNVQRVKRYRDDVPLFSAASRSEHQIEIPRYSRTVQLPSAVRWSSTTLEALVAVT